MTVKPRAARQVGEQEPIRLRADVRSSDDERYMTGYEVEIAARQPDQAKPWPAPVLQHQGDPWVDHPDVDVASAPRTGGKKVRRPWVARVERRPAARDAQKRPLRDRAKSTGRRPRFLIYSPEPIDAYDWQLFDDERERDGAIAATSGISEDGHWISLRPDKGLRRSGEVVTVKPRQGRFLPPFEPPRNRSRPRHYRGITYAAHTPFAIDFNRGRGARDLGDSVYASSPGTVEWVVESNGEVQLLHAGGWRTRYAHLDPVLVEEGDEVDTNTRIGRIGRRYWKEEEDGPISPHLHYQQLKGSAEKPVKFRGKEYEPGKKEPGWRRPIGRSKALLKLRVRRASDQEYSSWWPLRLRVAEAPQNRRGRADIALDRDRASLEPGKYSIRYRVTDDLGDVSDWAYDHTLEIT